MERIEITVNQRSYVWNKEEIWEHITFDPDMIDTILGYGTVYRYVSFGNIVLQDGTYDDILNQVNDLDDETIYEIMEAGK